MSGSPMLDNGFLLLKEDPGLGSPIGTLFYESYEKQDAVAQRLEAIEEELQCIVGRLLVPRGHSVRKFAATRTRHLCRWRGHC